LQRNAGRFHPVDSLEQPRAGEIAGYAETLKSGATIYYVLPSVWKSEIIAKAPRADLIKELDRLDLVIRQKPERNDYVKKVGKKPVRCYAISGDILALSDDGTLDDGVIEIAGDDETPDKVVHLTPREQHVVHQLATRH
jgi:hypothetical protein